MKKGFTLLELIIATLIFVLLSGIILAILITSNRSWRMSQNKLIEQQEARKAMDNIVGFLRQSNLDWVIQTVDPDDGSIIETHYPLSITLENRIDFYIPLFYPDCCPDNCADPSTCQDAQGGSHNAGEISTLKKITFKPDPNNSEQLLRKEGTAAPVIVATEIKDIKFTLVNLTVTTDITTEREKIFTLQSQATLRNQDIVLGEEVETEQPPEGEF